jgi:glucose uptake protein GlcU
MAPFKLVAGESQPSTVKVLSYVASFSLGSALLIAPLSLGYLLHLPDAAARATFLRAAKAAATPALLSGMLWAQANVMSVHATAYLGMRVGFPLTQTCVVFAALWGVLFFREMSLDCRDRLAWLSAGILAVLLGSYLLALSH